MLKCLYEHLALKKLGICTRSAGVGDTKNYTWSVKYIKMKCRAINIGNPTSQDFNGYVSHIDYVPQDGLPRVK